MVEIAYARNKKGDMVHISQITDRNDNYICSECDSDLTPVLGDINEHHFRHLNKEDCNRGEGALHKYAKEIISKKGFIYINGIKFQFKKCYNEFSLDERAIDFCGVLDNNQKIFIEIYVTHALESEKILKIVENGFVCYEIDIPISATPDEIERDFFEDNELFPKICINKTPQEDISRAMFYLRNQIKSFNFEKLRFQEEINEKKSILNNLDSEINYKREEINQLKKAYNYLEDNKKDILIKLNKLSEYIEYNDLKNKYENLKKKAKEKEEYINNKELIKSCYHLDTAFNYFDWNLKVEHRVCCNCGKNFQKKYPLWWK